MEMLHVLHHMPDPPTQTTILEVTEENQSQHYLLAPIILVVLTLILCRGVKESSALNSIMTVTKVVIVIFVILAGSFEIDVSNWSPFAPNGVKAILTGSTVVFFAYVGFDSVANSAEESKRPQSRLYLGLGRDGLLPSIFAKVHSSLHTPVHSQIWVSFVASVMAGLFNVHVLSHILSVGSLTGYSVVSACLVVLRWKDKASTHAPSRWISRWLEGVLCLIVVGLSGFGAGVLYRVNAPFILPVAAVLIAILATAALYYRQVYREPQGFSCPGVPLVPAVCIFFNIFLFAQLHYEAWVRFVILSIITEKLRDASGSTLASKFNLPIEAGYRRKSKPTLSFASASFISKNKGDFPVKACEVSEIHEDSGCRTKKQIDCLGQKAESYSMLPLAEVLRGECSTSKHSMAALLDGLQNKTDELLVNKEMSSRKRGQRRLSVLRRRTDPLRNRKIGRKRAMYNDLSRYVCCAGYMSCSGRCGECLYYALLWNNIDLLWNCLYFDFFMTLP